MKLRHFALCLPIALVLASPTPVGGQENPPEAPGTVLDYENDRWQRMTVPVMVEGKGPYPFVVDTGAERTVISEELAKDLQLGTGNRARLHSMSEVSDIVTVLIRGISVAGRKVSEIHAPALQRRNIGAEGILGVDSLQSQRVSFDFARQQITVAPSRRREEHWGEDTIVVTARNRLGHLVLVDASVEGQKVWVILDTGAQTTVANNALRRRLERKGRVREVHPIRMLSVTGGTILADATVVRTIRLGGVDINDMPVAFADVHPFKKLGLTDRPALLLGMDALKLFERVSVDFANRKVRLLPPGHTERSGTLFAAR